MGPQMRPALEVCSRNVHLPNILPPMNALKSIAWMKRDLAKKGIPGEPFAAKYRDRGEKKETAQQISFSSMPALRASALRKPSYYKPSDYKPSAYKPRQLPVSWTVGFYGSGALHEDGRDA